MYIQIHLHIPPTDIVTIYATANTLSRDPTSHGTRAANTAVHCAHISTHHSVYMCVQCISYQSPVITTYTTTNINTHHHLGQPRSSTANSQPHPLPSRIQLYSHIYTYCTHVYHTGYIVVFVQLQIPAVHHELICFWTPIWGVLTSFKSTLSASSFNCTPATVLVHTVTHAVHIYTYMLRSICM